ncbi:MAG: nucleotidyltransferase domain-containing protein [Desulfobacterales bacterium]
MNTVDYLKSKAVPMLKPYVRKISLFGSFARGENADQSDIDLLVELKSSGLRPVLGLKWFGLERELGRIMGRRIELISEANISPHLKPFIAKDQVLLYEED